MKLFPLSRNLPVEAIYVLGAVILIVIGFAAFFANNRSGLKKKTLIVGKQKERSTVQGVYEADILRANAAFASTVKQGASRQFWSAAGLTNRLDKEVTVCIWSSKGRHWFATTLRRGETKYFIRENEAIHVLLQGNLIVTEKNEENWAVENTGGNRERYVLDAVTFDHEPTDQEQRAVPAHILTSSSVGALINFADESQAKVVIQDAHGEVCTGFVTAEQVGLELIMADPDLTLFVPNDNR